MSTRPLSDHSTWSRHGLLSIFRASAVLLVLGGCRYAGVDDRAPALPRVDIEVSRLGSLDSGDGPVLASASSLVPASDGRIYIADRSDRRIKVFRPNGSQGPAVGAPGAGPGEFTTLMSAGVMRDSVLGWDMRANRVTVFDREGRYARAFALRQPGSPQFSHVRVMDDSLLVGSGWVMGAHDRPLVEVFDRKGTRIGRLADMKGIFSPPNPKLLPHTWVFADGKGGTVFSTIHGVDTILAHAPDGRLLGSGRLGLRDHEPVLDLFRLLEENRGDLQRPDSSWVQDGHYAALNLVALGDDLVAVQFGRLDLKGGTDLLSSGGPIVVLWLGPDGVIRWLGQKEAPGALLGRNARGDALLLRWSGDDLADLELFRMAVRRP